MGFETKQQAQNERLVAHPGGKSAEPDNDANNAEDALDKSLVTQFVNGDRKAFDQLVARYKERIYTFIYFQINQRQDDAEDLTQDVFIELYRQAEKYRGDSKFSTYLFAISRNVVLNYFRAQRRRHQDQTDSISQEQLTPDAGQHLSNQLVADECPENSTINDNMQQKVESAIEQLKPDERQLLLLTDREGFSYEQVGQILAIKVGTVRSRLNAARNKLIDFLKS